MPGVAMLDFEDVSIVGHDVVVEGQAVALLGLGEAPEPEGPGVVVVLKVDPE